MIAHAYLTSNCVVVQYQLIYNNCKPLSVYNTILFNAYVLSVKLDMWSETGDFLTKDSKCNSHSLMPFI